MNIIKRLRSITGLSQSKFAKLFGIPIRNIQKWEIHQAEPTRYLQEMMLRVLIAEENDFNEEELKVLQQWYSEQNDSRR